MPRRAGGGATRDVPVWCLRTLGRSRCDARFAAGSLRVRDRTARHRAELYHVCGGLCESAGGGEIGFERALWSQLQRLHDIDRTLHRWDPHVAADPASADFSFSIGGVAFFIVGLHPDAERASRRFPWPALVFNAHEQFEDLREHGQLDGLKAQIRERDVALQGTINPNLADFGHHSEARQYAGREVGTEWTCPFRPT